MPTGTYQHKPNQGFQKGYKSFKFWLGKKRPPFTEEHKRNIRMGGAGRPKGFKVSELTREKMIKAKMGNKNRFIKDRSLVKIQDERNNPIYKQWRYQVFKRDRHICRISNNNCNGKVVVHHILPWRDYPELRYNINNGITLCQFHHPHKRIDEQRLIPTFRSMVEVK